MIILVGPDNTGKTTLATQLTEQGAISFHCNTNTIYEDYIKFLTKPTETQHMVFDRWFLCDLVYAKVVRKEMNSKFTYQQIQIMRNLTSMYNPIVLLATRQGENFLERIQLSTKEQHEELLLEYERVLTTLNFPYALYDWKQPSIVAKELLSMAKEIFTPEWLRKEEDTVF